MYQALLQAVYDLYVIEIYDNTTSGATGNLSDFICLHSDLHVLKSCEKGELEMIAGFSNCV